MTEEYEDGVLSLAYTHEPGLYGNLLSQNRNGVTSYYHYDGRGDTVALTDAESKGVRPNSVRHAACVLVDCDGSLVDLRVAEFR